MFDRFTDRARKVMGLSREEALRFNHDYIGTEHVLLGLIQEGSGVAADVLKNLDVDPKRIRTEVEKFLTPGTAMVTMGQLPFTKRAKKMLEFSLEEASNLGHNYIGTEHLLLGLIREEEGIAAQVLRKLNITLEGARAQVLHLLGAEPPAQEMAPPASRAGEALAVAQREAWQRGHEEVGTGHILLGVIDEAAGHDDGVRKLLLRGIRAEAEKLVPPAGEPVAEIPLPFAPSAKAALEAARREAPSHGGLEYLLRAILREEGAAAKLLHAGGIRLEDVAPAPAPARLGFFEGFADRSRVALGLARQEAQRLNHDYIGPEHILLGLLGANDGTVEVLKALGVDPARVRAETEKRVARGSSIFTDGQIPFTAAAKRALELAVEEANSLGSRWILDEHLLLGLIREEKGTAAQALAALGVKLDAVRGALGPRNPPE